MYVLWWSNTFCVYSVYIVSPKTILLLRTVLLQVVYKSKRRVVSNRSEEWCCACTLMVGREFILATLALSTDEKDKEEKPS